VSYLTNSGKIELHKIFSRECGLLLDFGENINRLWHSLNPRNFLTNLKS
jgi:RNAse (barnase) inhibitor barstar